MVSRLMTSRRGTSIVPEDKTHLLMAKLEDGGEAFELTWDRSSQHTISWSKPLKLHVRSIPTVIAAGSCNLYAFPSVDGQTPSSAQIQVLVKMLTALVNDSIFDMPDSSGATPLLALLVANNSDAIDLSLMLYHARPILLEQAHLDGPFVGETALHIVAINRQEDALCKMLQLAHEHLNSEQLERVFLTQATGGFFLDEPMALYGGTPLAYAATFGLRRAIVIMLSLSARSTKMQGLLDINHPRLACRRTGFLPLHAIVANGNKDMYDFLTSLPDLPILASYRASEEVLSRQGTASQFTALQLACHLGDGDMFEHILQRRSELVWRWGPLAQFKIDLEGIDSVGGGANDISDHTGAQTPPSSSLAKLPLLCPARRLSSLCGSSIVQERA